MSDLDTLRDSFPEYAKDIKINLGTVLTTDGSQDLTELQIACVSLSVAYSINNPALISALENQFSVVLTDELKNSAKAASAIMSMNNIYYRALHLANDQELSKLPARLRMNIINNSGVPKNDFELMSLAVSCINGCGACIESHAKHLSENGVSKQSIQSAIRIAAVLNAASNVLRNI